jgi:copper chaperone CopZ
LDEIWVRQERSAPGAVVSYCSRGRAPTSPKFAKNEDHIAKHMIQKLHMDIEGMHCGACATGIQMVTEGVDGVKTVFVSYDAKNGDWEYDDEKTSKEAIIKEIEALGYKAK